MIVLGVLSVLTTVIFGALDSPTSFRLCELGHWFCQFRFTVLGDEVRMTFVDVMMLVSFFALKTGKFNS